MTTKRRKNLAHKRALYRAAQKRYYDRCKDHRRIAGVEYDAGVLDKLVALNYLDDDKTSDVKEVGRAIERVLRAIDLENNS